MVRTLLFLLASVFLGGAFGVASASGRVIDEGLVEIRLEVESDVGSSVVAHLLEPGADERTVSMAESSEGGRYSTVFTARPIDLAVVFELLGPDAEQSDPYTLTALGLDPAVLGMTPTNVPDPDSADSRRWGWLAIGMGAASLSLLAVWALGGDSRSEAGPATD